jgi:hypothetical protein
MGLANLHAIGLGDGTDVVGSSNGADNRRLLVGVREALASEVCRAALGRLEDDGCLDVAVCIRAQFSYPSM